MYAEQSLLNSQKNPIEVEIIIGSLERGGAERHVSLIAPALAAKGIKVIVRSLSSNNPLKQVIAFGGVEVIEGAKVPQHLFTPIRKIVRLTISMSTLICSMLVNRKRIRHVFLPEAFILTALAAKLTFLPAPLIMSRRSLNHYQKRRPFLAIIERLLYSKVTLSLGNSKAVADQLIDEGIPATKVGLIYNGIDSSNLDNLNKLSSDNKMVMRKLHDLPTNAVILIVVANLIPYKGHLDLLEALVIASPEIKQPWCLVCVGKINEPLFTDLQNFCKKFGLGEENIKFVGEQPSPQEWLLACDILILPSHEEGFANVIVEAMSASLPVIATDVGGNKEAVIDMQTGLIVPPHDPAFLAKAMLTLIENSSLRQEFGINGRARFEKHFKLDKCVDQYITVYKTIHGSFNDLVN